LGGAAGGFVSSSAALCEVLAQRSRPQLFSNALPPTVACSARAAVQVLLNDKTLIPKLRKNVEYFRKKITAAGFKPLDGDSAIVPIIVGETARAIDVSRRLLDEGVFVTGFGFPVVPEGAARIRVQISAALEEAHMDRAIAAFGKVGSDTGLVA
jgi:glycine C-acetyltransferase